METVFVCIRIPFSCIEGVFIQDGKYYVTKKPDTSLRQFMGIPVDKESFDRVVDALKGYDAETPSNE